MVEEPSSYGVRTIDVIIYGNCHKTVRRLSDKFMAIAKNLKERYSCITILSCLHALT